MRLVVGALLALALVACVDPFGNLPDGVQIDGVVVGPPVDCATTSCTKVIDCASMAEFRTETPSGVAATAVYSQPVRLRDGTAITRGVDGQVVVFEMQDGSRRAVTVMGLDSCMTGSSAKGNLPDGKQIDGIWIGRGDACQDGGDEGFCRALLTCAVEAEFGGVDPGIDTWRVHGPPDRLRDGTLLTYGGNVTIVVFELKDGTRRATQLAETDRCR